MFQLHENIYLFISHQFMCIVVDMYNFVLLEVQDIMCIWNYTFVYFTAKLMLVHNVKTIPYGNK